MAAMILKYVGTTQWSCHNEYLQIL